MKKVRSILAIIAIAASVLVAGTLILFNTMEPFRWRADVMLRYLSGGIEDATLSELLKMMRPGTKYYITGLSRGQGMTAVLRSPYGDKEGIEAGSRIYRERCVSCHGTDAGGGPHAPSLKILGSYRHGGSDWAIYRNIANGIPGTGMPPLAGLSFDEAWQVVSFLHSNMTDSSHEAVLDADKRAAKELLANNFSGLSFERLLAADSDANEWRTYSRTYNGWRFSPLTQINTGNVAKLRLRWMRQLETQLMKVEATPIVVDGIMFITEPLNNVLALDASNGTVLWTYKHKITEKLSICCGEVNRGVAVLDGMVYMGTLDAHLVALEARTGKLVWDIKLAEPKGGYSITGAPLAVRDMIVTGMAGGEFGTRGFLHAVDAKTGKMRWRFYTIPGPGEPGNDTWSGDSWKTGGAPTWVTGSFDPNLNLIYWGVGNPNPDHDGDVRAGDNLYSNSVVALDATTGTLAWHFQFTPHDEHDWDSNQVPILASVKLKGVETPVIAWANRNAFYYVLDRRNGRFITGVPFVRQNWATGLDRSGRPILTPAAKVTTGGVLTEPDVGGGTNWQSPAFNPVLGLFFVNSDESKGVFTKTGETKPERKPYMAYGGSGVRSVGENELFVRALKIATGEKVWEYKSKKDRSATYSGLLATAGGLVFGAGAEKAFALDAATGQELWSIPSGGGVWQGPISYGDSGQQVIIYISGRTVIALSL